MKKLILLALLTISFFSCKDKKINLNDNVYQYKEFIVRTTSGRVSKLSDVKITFSKAITKQDVGTELTSAIVEISPKVKGKFFTEDLHNIVFIPDVSLDPKTEYTVVVKLDKLFDNVPKELKKYQFQFVTITLVLASIPTIYNPILKNGNILLDLFDLLM